MARNGRIPENMNSANRAPIIFDVRDRLENITEASFTLRRMQIPDEGGDGGNQGDGGKQQRR